MVLLILNLQKIKKNADDNKIYYYDNNYYRRVNKYKYEEVISFIPNSDFTIEEILIKL